MQCSNTYIRIIKGLVVRSWSPWFAALLVDRCAVMSNACDTAKQTDPHTIPGTLTNLYTICSRRDAAPALDLRALRLPVRVSAPHLERLIAGLYAGAITLDADSVCDVLAAAAALQVRLCIVCVVCSWPVTM